VAQEFFFEFLHTQKIMLTCLQTTRVIESVSKREPEEEVKGNEKPALVTTPVSPEV